MPGMPSRVAKMLYLRLCPRIYCGSSRDRNDGTSILYEQHTPIAITAHSLVTAATGARNPLLLEIQGLFPSLVSKRILLSKRNLRADQLLPTIHSIRWRRKCKNLPNGVPFPRPSSHASLSACCKTLLIHEN
jgi:hypothetical protein